jgi:O-antigen/teichoic acid export membrane protein
LRGSFKVALKKNVIANYLGQAWIAVISLAFVPLYIKYLGIESYGVIGFYSLLQTCFSLFDMGMTPTLSREMARFKGGANDAQSTRDLLRSIEIISLGINVLFPLAVWLASSWLASDWLRVETLSVGTVARAFTIMGCVTSLRFFENIYRSCIIGLQKQVLMNIILCTTATLRSGGAIAVLMLIAPTIEAFFLWQGVISVVTIVLLASAVYRALPATNHSAKFSLDELEKIWRFASGMMGITLLSLLLTQVDKLILSKLLTLKQFGYYALAGSVSGSLYMLVGPITQAFYPRFNELVVSNSQQRLAVMYHTSAQLVAILTGSAAVVLIFFGDVILNLWTQDVVLSSHVAPLLSVLALGNLINALMHIPYQLQLAYGWTSLAIKINIVSVLVIIPAIVVGSHFYGAIGAAWAWVVLNSGYLLFGAQFMYRRLLSAEKWSWYLYDVFTPIAISSLVAICFRYVMLDLLSQINRPIAVLVGGTLVLFSSIFSASLIRTPIVRYLSVMMGEIHQYWS